MLLTNASLTNVVGSCRIRELTAVKVGSLVRISGQVVRTHPVHPELVSGTFLCLDCQGMIKDVEQQFKYTQPSICRNPVCNNRRRFLLDTNKSKFIDFQKVWKVLFKPYTVTFFGKPSYLSWNVGDVTVQSVTGRVQESCCEVYYIYFSVGSAKMKYMQFFCNIFLSDVRKKSIFTWQFAIK